MTRRSRIYYSDSQKALMWERWKAGETLHQIAHLFDRSHSSVHRILAETGGIRPSARRRSRLAITLIEREEISRYLVEGLSIRAIAERLGRAPSTISREISRNGGRPSYRAIQADQETWRRAHRPKPCKLVALPGLARIVTAKLQMQWSPEQIAGWLKHTYGSLTESTLRALIRATENRGHAVIGHYSVPGVIGIGMALRNGTGTVMGAITTASIDARMSRADQEVAALCISKHIERVQASLDML
jgi:DNA-binding CsgD family transcriptional regulator